ncbi:protein kintoun [Paroedura picta]|uniref:protein kintoun n=1 Tax=Paroedura picta TaxID=143630 RepID=UPI0040574332
MAGCSGLEALELTGEEAERLRRAFADEEFRRLFAEYAAELSDPAQRAVYEAEVAALERQRGVEARFLHPSPGWVLRTSQAGARRCYVNVCANALVARPEARREAGGSRWALPHCLAPGREELGRRPRAPRRLVYDVLFHPDALRLAARSARFRRLLDDTALDAVESHFAPGLDRANAAPLRGTKYKGLPVAALLRTPLPGNAAPAEQDHDDGGGASPLPPFRTPYAYPPRPAEAPRSPPAPAPAPAATTPRWTLRQRAYVDLQDYRCSRDSAPSPVPRELEVTVELPLLSSAAQACLEVRGRELQLDSRRPAAYRLRLRLPYAVDEEQGRATFDKSQRRLVVTLPVLRPALPGTPHEQQEKEDAPAAHGGTNHVQLPVCAEERGPPGSAEDLAGSGPAPKLPGDPETSDQVASEGSSGSAAPTATLDSRGQETACEGLPAAPGMRQPAVTPAGLGAEMALQQSPEAARAEPCSELHEAAVPSPHLSGVGSEHPVTTQCPSPDMNVETGPCPDGSRHPGSSPAALTGSPSTDLCGTGDFAANSPLDSPLLSGTGLALDPEPAPSPSSSPAPPLCPPFQCTQDEESLTLLLQVPGIVPHSLRGEVGTHHYRVSFATKDSASYSLLLQLPAENQLTSPEGSISVSLGNAVIHLAKAPGSTGLWTKLYFGLNEDALQEKFFVTEDNVAEFLDNLRRPSDHCWPETEPQPLTEVLEVSESQSRIRLKAQERNSPDAGPAEEKVNPGSEDGRRPSRAESHPAGEHGAQTEAASDSLAAAETKEPAGWGQGHCAELGPAEPGSAAPGKLQESGLTFAVDSGATGTEQRPLDGGEQAGTGEKVHAGVTEPGHPPGPVLQETDMRDGSVRLISQHATHCAVTFQNPLLYELD